MKIKYIITVDAQEAEDKKLELEEIKRGYSAEEILSQGCGDVNTLVFSNPLERSAFFNDMKAQGFLTAECIVEPVFE